MLIPVVQAIGLVTLAGENIFYWNTFFVSIAAAQVNETERDWQGAVTVVTNRELSTKKGLHSVAISLN
jgi:hypothetical protein